MVTANRVDIDLQGRTIRGNGTGFGVRDQNLADSLRVQFAITLRNGTIANFESGVSLVVTQGAVVEQLRVVESTVTGIKLFSGRVRSNVVIDVDNGNGIDVEGAGVVSDNFVSQVGKVGIFVFEGVVVGNTVSAVWT